MGLLDIALNKAIDKVVAPKVAQNQQSQAQSAEAQSGHSLYMKQEFTFLNDKYSLFDSNQNAVYDVKGSLGGLEFKVTKAGTDEVVLVIKKKLIAIMPEYSIEKNGQKIGTIKKKMKLTKVNFEGTINNQNINVEGNFIGYDFNVSLGTEPLCTIKKELLAWADTYAIHYEDESKIDAILGIVIAIDNAVHNTND